MLVTTTGSLGPWVDASALSPWTVASGNCYINSEGCFETEYFGHSECDGYHEACTVEISSDWKGSLDVVDAIFDVGMTVLTVKRA